MMKERQGASNAFWVLEPMMNQRSASHSHLAVKSVGDHLSLQLASSMFHGQTSNVLNVV